MSQSDIMCWLRVDSVATLALATLCSSPRHHATARNASAESAPPPAAASDSLARDSVLEEQQNTGRSIGQAPPAPRRRAVSEAERGCCRKALPDPADEGRAWRRLRTISLALVQALSEGESERRDRHKEREGGGWAEGQTPTSSVGVARDAAHDFREAPGISDSREGIEDREKSDGAQRRQRREELARRMREETAHVWEGVGRVAQRSLRALRARRAPIG
jgi:hypothetical protein